LQRIELESPAPVAWIRCTLAPMARAEAAALPPLAAAGDAPLKLPDPRRAWRP
jgi:hypothetical protein